MDTHNPQGDSFPSSTPSPCHRFEKSSIYVGCHYELVGGPLDGMESCRSVLGLLIDGMLIMRMVDGELLLGHMRMPGMLRLLQWGRLYTYYLDVDRGRYIYGGVLWKAFQKS